GPGVPSSISAPATDSDGAFAVSWGSATGTVTSYVLERQKDGGSFSQVYSGSGTSYNVTGLSAGTYVFRVKACDGSTCGGYRTSSGTTVSGQQSGGSVPAAPQPFDAIGNVGSIVPSGDISGTDQVGSVNGAFRVDESGAATYSVAIAAAAGTADVVPQIGLNYSSSAGNGLLGLGWSINGLTAISRCRQTLHQDGKAKPITWTDA